jgi:hypothetical protein
MGSPYQTPSPKMKKPKREIPTPLKFESHESGKLLPVAWDVLTFSDKAHLFSWWSPINIIFNVI